MSVMQQFLMSLSADKCCKRHGLHRHKATLTFTAACTDIKRSRFTHLTTMTKRMNLSSLVSELEHLTSVERTHVSMQATTIWRHTALSRRSRSSSQGPFWRPRGPHPIDPPSVNEIVTMIRGTVDSPNDHVTTRRTLKTEFLRFIHSCCNHSRPFFDWSSLATYSIFSEKLNSIQNF